MLLIALLLVLGDVFWTLHIKTSDSEFPEDSLTLMVLAVLVFPVIEEFGFRLWTQSYLEEKMNPYLATALVAAVFAVVHKADMPISQLLSGML